MVCNLALCQFGYDISPYRQKNPTHYELVKKRISEANISSQSIFRLRYTKEEILEDSLLWMYFEYDKKGNDIFFEMFTESTGEPDGFLRKMYDFLDNEIVSVNYKYVDSNFIMTDSTYKVYDEFNRLHFLLVYNSEHNIKDIGFNIYDNNGNMIYSEFAAINRTHFYRERYFYDEDNKLKFSIRTNKNIASTEIRIDTVYPPKGKKNEQLVKYNKKGNIKEWLDKTLKQDIIMFRFEFDSDDNVIQKEYYERGELIYRIVYQYNMFKLLNKETQYDSRGKIIEQILYIYGFE
jgi:hypothetical protein